MPKILINYFDLPAVLGLTLDDVNGGLLLPPNHLIEHGVETTHKPIQILLVVFLLIRRRGNPGHLAALARQLDRAFFAVNRSVGDLARDVVGCWL